MDLNLQKAEFSYAYIATIASAAGFVVQNKRMPMDYVGVDISIEAPAILHDMFVPSFYAQVKCTSSKIIYDTEVHLRITVDQYNKLCLPSCNDQYLIVVSVPDEPKDWLYASEDKTILQHCAYFHSLKGCDLIDGDYQDKRKNKVTIKFSRDQMLTPDSLRQIMSDVAESKKQLFAIDKQLRGVSK